MHHVSQSKDLLDVASVVHGKGFKTLDALHIACAIVGEANFFLTTDDGILRKAALVRGLSIVNPLKFVEEISLEKVSDAAAASRQTK